LFQMCSCSFEVKEMLNQFNYVIHGFYTIIGNQLILIR